MNNAFMKEFKSRLLKGIMVGVAMIAFEVLTGILSHENIFSGIPWFLIPVLLILTVLYGTGWYFAINLLKRSFRKFLRVGRNASIWQALTGRGIWIGLLYGFLCLIVGCVLSFLVGNYFMIRDYLLARKGKPPISVKYKFDSDLEYNQWAEDLATIGMAVSYSDTVNNASPEQRANNEMNIENIKNGYAGTVTTDIDDGNRHIKKKTTIY